MKEIIEAGRGLALNQNIVISCPFCKYSRRDKREKSLSISRVEAGFVYICFRATCGKKGIVSESPIPGKYIQAQKKAFKPIYCTRPLVYIPEDIYKDNLGIYGLSRKDVDYQEIRWDKEDRRIYAPVRDHREYIIGGVGKVVDKGRKPKVIAYRHSERPFIHFPKGQIPSDNIILVEDFISATKIAKICYCAALLGTNLTEEMFSYLKKEVGIKNFLLFFDADAHQKMLKIKHKYGARGNFKLMMLSKEQRDPKDLSRKELEELLL